jgi:hypothetical protein
MNNSFELAACTPHPVHPNGFNSNAEIPYGCTTQHIQLAMNDFIFWLYLVLASQRTIGSFLAVQK